MSAILTDEMMREKFEGRYQADSRDPAMAEQFRFFAEGAAIGAEIEREACAKVCEDRPTQLKLYDHAKWQYQDCAAAIRARAGKEGG